MHARPTACRVVNVFVCPFRTTLRHSAIRLGRSETTTYLAHQMFLLLEMFQGLNLKLIPVAWCSLESRLKSEGQLLFTLCHKHVSYLPSINHIEPNYMLFINCVSVSASY